MTCLAVLLGYESQLLTSIKKICAKENSGLTLQLSFTESEYGNRDRAETDWDEDMNTDDEDSGEESVCFSSLL